MCRPLVLRRIDVLEVREHGRHRVVDPYVDRSECLLDLLAAASTASKSATSADTAWAVPAEPLGLLGGRPQARLPARDQSDGRAVAREFLGDRPADARRGTGHDDYLARSHVATPFRSETNASIAWSRSTSSRARRIEDG